MTLARKTLFALLPVRIALMVIGLLAVAAMLFDLNGFRLKAEKVLKPDEPSTLVNDAMIDVVLATNRIAAPGGGFSLALPAGWGARDPGEAYDLRLHGPLGMELAVSVRAAAVADTSALRAEFAAVETNLGLRMEPAEVHFLGRTAWHRHMPLPTAGLDALDFIEDGRHVHLLASAPAKVFPEVRPVLAELLASFRFEDRP